MKVRNEKGMVLLLVLVVIALLSALLSEFAFSTLVDLRLTETFRDSTKAEYLALGGIKAGRMILQEDKNSYDAHSQTEFWSIGIQDYPLAEGNITVKIEDLDGRLWLNKLVDSAGNPNILYRERFIRLCSELAIDSPATLADALIDWIDADHDPSPGGAEDGDYLAENPPYEATDAPLQSLDELYLVRGFNAKTVSRLRPFVSSFGSGRLNINTAAPELLRSWDSESISNIENLLSSRAKKPFTHLNDLRDAIGMESYTALNRNLDLGVTSTYYRINSMGRVNDGTRRMQAVVNKPKDTLLWQKVN
jgi:general secretion pathway protein K